MKYLKSMTWALGLLAAAELSLALEVNNPAGLSVKYCSGADCSLNQNDSGVDAIVVSGGNPQPIKSACIIIASSGQVSNCGNNTQPNANSQQWQQNNEPEFRR